jgi:hypothetical protein
MGSKRMKRTKRRTGAMLQAVGVAVMLAGLVYGVTVYPLSPTAVADSSAIMMIAALTMGLFLLGFTILIAGAWMARIADARFGSV